MYMPLSVLQKINQKHQKQQYIPKAPKKHSQY